LSSKNNAKDNNDNIQQRRQFTTSLRQHHYYYFIAAAVATGIAGIVHLYVPFSHSVMPKLSSHTVFFIGRMLTMLLQNLSSKQQLSTCLPL
jgi:hypothetical protein